MKKKGSKGKVPAGDSSMRWLKRENFGSRLVLLWMAFFAGLVVAAFASVVASRLVAGLGDKAVVSAQIMLQDLLVFIMPAYVTARFACGKPMRFLRAETAPTWRAVVFVALLLALLLPCLNYITWLNESVTLPDSMASMERWMRATEDAARQVTEMLLAGNSLAAMLGCVLLIGVLTGLSEEAFFRGALMNVLARRQVNRHVCVWFVALIFSVLHFQFYGFVPRLLLGAIFGYAVIWSGSLWTAVIAHALNNSVVVVSDYLMSGGMIGTDIDTVGVPESGAFPALAVMSALLSCLLIRHRGWFFPSK